jgi:hypothetical protein
VQGGCPTGSTCTNLITTDPRLGTLRNYGGSTLTIPLLPGSSAINAGNDAVCPSTDQRGVTRPQSTHCDIGAFEVEIGGITVTRTDDRNATCIQGDTPDCSLREALDIAITGNTIIFDPALTASGPATVTLSLQDTNAANLYGPTAFYITKAIDIRGPVGANGLTLTRANGAANMRLFTVAPDASLTLENLTLSGGRAVGGSGGLGGGGGAAGLGGAIFNAGTLTATACTLTNNTAQGGSGTGSSSSNAGGGGGGGLRDSGGDTVPSSKDYGAGGGGPNGGGGGSQTNYGGGGGGVGGNGGFGGGGGAGGYGALNNTGGNGGSGGFGGGGGGGGNGRYAGFGGAGNGGIGGNGGFGGGGGGGGGSQTGWGGGGGNGGFGGAGGTFGGNFYYMGGTGGGGAGLGGAIFNYTGTVAILNSSLFANTAQVGSGGSGGKGYGGALFAYGGQLSITNTTLSGNTAADGGRQVYLLGNGATAYTLVNSILGQADTSVTDFVANTSTGPISGAGHTNLIRTSAGLAPALTGTITTDPLLSAPGSYGGATATLPLLPGSPALKQATSNCPATDQRGVARGSTCDLGAFESRGYTLTKTGGDPQTTLLNTAFAQPLGVRLSETGGGGLPGAAFAFTAPAGGASAALSSLAATTGSDGGASVTATANSLAGSYLVTITVSGILTPITFALANTANTHMAISAAPNPSTFGQIITITTSVSVDGSSSTPPGSVTFKDNGTSISGCEAQALDGNGQATCATSALAAGAHSVSAEYGGGVYYNPSTAAYSQAVNLAPTTTTVTSSANPSVAGSAVMFTVTVTSPYTTPVGTVDLYEKTPFSAQALGAPAAAGKSLVGGVVTYTAASLAAGTHTLLAIYSGAANFTSSLSGQYAQVVNPLPLYALTINTAGNGSGTVIKSPDQISYTAGTVVTLTAVPAAGSVFAGWSGAADCADGVVTLDADKACTATFTLNSYTLTVTMAGNGSGTVTPTVGTHTYLYGTVITLTATANPGSTFAGWGGAADCADGVVTFDANKACTATFTLNSYTLTVTTTGNGSGSVTPTVGAHTYPYGTVITLTATANPGSTFAGWSGAAVSTTNPLVLTMDAAKAVTATFVSNQVTYRVFLPMLLKP